MRRIDQLRAQVLEYEHALEHVVDDYLDGTYHQPGRCEGCVAVAKSALARENKTDFEDLVKRTGRIRNLWEKLRHGS